MFRWINAFNKELKEREKRGDEYEWHDVGKSNYNYIFNIFLIIDGKVEKKKEEDNNYEGKYYTVIITKVMQNHMHIVKS